MVSGLLYSMWREHHQAEKIMTGVSTVKPANDNHNTPPQGVMA
jgi:hypothetical protein